MKKSFVIIILILNLFAVNIMPVYANTIDGIDSSKEISEQNQQEIFQYTAEFIESHKETSIEKEDIEFNNSYKIHSNTNLLNYDILNNKNIPEITESSDYCYYVPINFENDSVNILLNKNDETGLWEAVGFQMWDYKFDYANHLSDLLQKNSITDADVYVVGGISGNLEEVAVICRDNEDVQFLILDGWDTDTHHISNDNPDSKLYSYEEIKNMAVFYDFEEGENGGGYIQTENGANSRLTYILIIGGIAAAIAIITVIAVYLKTEKIKISWK